MNPVDRTAANLEFPFNRLAYAETYGGQSLYARGLSSALTVQPVPGTGFFDGRLPWPYIHLPEAGEMHIRNDCPELVTVTGVIAPSSAPPSSTARPNELEVFKPHFIYDPSLGLIELSSKSAGNLRKGARVWEAADPDSREGWEAFIHLNRQFVLSRHLFGGFFDFGDEHFRRLSTLEGMRLFGVRSPVSWGAMACGAEFEGEIHLMHIRISSHGYRTFASYVLMADLIRRCRESRKPLFLGGVHQGGGEGALRFKRRWSNRTLPAWLFKVIIRPDIYEGLAIRGNPFFPGYRLPPCPDHLEPAGKARMGDGGS